MDKYIGFHIAYKKTVACVVQKGKPDKYDMLPTDVNVMQLWLHKQRKPGDRLHLIFEVSGQSGCSYDDLRDRVDSLAMSNSSQMTWIYRTAKKTDRIDARKQAVHRTLHVGGPLCLRSWERLQVLFLRMSGHGLRLYPFSRRREGLFLRLTCVRIPPEPVASKFSDLS